MRVVERVREGRREREREVENSESMTPKRDTRWRYQWQVVKQTKQAQAQESRTQRGQEKRGVYEVPLVGINRRASTAATYD